ncbi:MAG: beta strand repeat-containing protein, partial [Candidatus Geothermincolia bacterium]
MRSGSRYLLILGALLAVVAGAFLLMPGLKQPDSVSGATPAAAISSVSPTSGAQGQMMNVAIVGASTTFANGTSVASFGAGITVNSTTVTDSTHATANITISAAATVGARSVNVVTGSETPAALAGGFTVRDAKVASINPASGAQGQTMNVAIVGTSTAFANGTSVASFGAGITVNSTAVTDTTHATANITIDAAATSGTRSVNVITGGETPDALATGFTVRDAKIASIGTASGAQGQTMNVAIVGTSTAFVNGTSVASFGAGITVNSTSVTDATHATANITIDAAATAGPGDVNVITGGETPDLLASAFTVRDAKIISVNPTSGAQGQTMNVAIVGSDTALVNGSSVASFGAGITVNSTTVTDPAHATANITVTAAAVVGARGVNVVTGGETPDLLAGAFTVRDARIISATPSSGARGQTMDVALVGAETAFVNGTSVGSFGAGI